jgi:hypothetical protein
VIRRSRRLTLTGVVITFATLLLTACADYGPHAPASKDSSMTPEQSHDNVMEIFGAVRSVVGEEGWDEGTESEWNSCSSHGEDGAQFTLTAIRKHPLPATPDAVTGRVAAALRTSIGLDGAPVEHDDTLKPARTVVAYPHGYNGGTAADGFGVEFQSGTDFASLLVYGHCVPGKPPKLGTPLNPRPSDAP